MSRLSHRALPASLIALALAMPALAQEAEDQPIIIDQLETGDIWSSMNVVVPDTADYAASTATSTGNSASVLLKSGDVDLIVNQEMTGNSSAEARLEGGVVMGQASAVATAYGNAVNTTTEDGSSASQTEQVMSGDTVANAEIELLGGNTVIASATAIANAVASHAEYGEHIAEHVQHSEGSASATTDADMCCDGSGASFATVAGGNAVSSTGYTSTAIQSGTQTTAAGATLRGLTDVYIYEATDVVAATTVAGNSYVLENQFGYASLGEDGDALSQTNESEVDAQTYLTVGAWNGLAGATAYGVGNSALVSNLGSDTALYADQTNSATVGAQASFDGASTTGGVATLSATAMGNAATASLCITCGDATVSGTTRQVNSGNVYAIGTMSVPTSGGIIGSATAIGNSATYQSSGY
ncbi:MAG: holdfast anchor protein HfaD [Hyphomonadaceae bacterium]|nr:holdfast anchor protein HfaD [Hyphomonadaceae bacterium]